MSTVMTSAPEIEYPESDGEPMAENTVQLAWIVLLYDNLCALFGDRPDVFVAADLFWYPVEGDSKIRTAPDVMIVFGRPKGHRSSYMQWKEAAVPVTVVIEILSPKNTVPEMGEKLAFYDTYGVEEYYVFDPQTNEMVVHSRRGQALVCRGTMREVVSPRLGIRFDLTREEMVVYDPNGKPFLTYLEQRDLQTRAEVQAAQVQKRLQRLAELSRKARQQQASPQELAELEQLENETPG